MSIQSLRESKEELKKKIIILLDEFESKQGIKIERVSSFRNKTKASYYKEEYKSLHNIEITLEII